MLFIRVPSEAGLGHHDQVRVAGDLLKSEEVSELRI